MIYLVKLIIFFIITKYIEYKIMNNKFFDFLSNLSNELNDGVVETLDFTKKEDVEKLENAVKTLKTNEFFSTLFGNDLFDQLLDKAHQIYFEAHKGPSRPSSKVVEQVKSRIQNLATEYVKENIEPYAKELTDKQKNDIIDSLFEFGCWIYNK